MRLATLLGPDLKQTLAEDPAELLEALEEFHAEDIAEVVADLEDDVALSFMRLLPEELAAEVLERVDEEVRSRILEMLGTNEAAEVLAEMSADDRVDALQELPDDVAEKILDRLEETEPEVADEVRELRSYDASSAGGIMTTEYVSLPPETKIWQSIEHVRAASHSGRAETISYVYVVAYGDKLVGVVSLRDLILAVPSKSLADIMTENVVRALPTPADPRPREGQIREARSRLLHSPRAKQVRDPLPHEVAVRGLWRIIARPRDRPRADDAVHAHRPRRSHSRHGA